MALLCEPEWGERAELVVADEGRLRFVAAADWWGKNSECDQEARFGPMPQPLAERERAGSQQRLSLDFGFHHEGYGVALGIRGEHLVVVAEDVWSFDVLEEPDERGVTRIERDWDRRTSHTELAWETWDEKTNDYQRVWSHEYNTALLSGCVGSEGPLMRQPHLFRHGAREQIEAQDVDLRVGVVDATSAPLELRVLVSDDHSIAAADGSAGALLRADHLELWTRAPGNPTNHDEVRDPRWGWLIGRDRSGAWHLARHPRSQGNPPAGVTAQHKGDELWLALPPDAMEQKDDWFTARSRALAVVAVDVDENGKPPEAVISTGTIHEERPELSVLSPCAAPGPYPGENNFVKIREL